MNDKQKRVQPGANHVRTTEPGAISDRATMIAHRRAIAQMERTTRKYQQIYRRALARMQRPPRGKK